MIVILLICGAVLIIATDVISVWMKMRVNKNLPEQRRLSWWSRDYGQVNKLYAEQNPDSILPGLNHGLLLLVLALFVVMVAVGMVRGK